MSVQLADHELATLAQEGDESAFEELYERHGPRCWRLALAAAGTPRAAATAVTEGFATVCTALRTGRIDADAHVGTHLLIATRNAAVDQPRAFDASAHARAGADTAIVADAFAPLPERARSALWLAEVEGFSARRAAPILALTTGAATQVLARAVRGFRTRWLESHVACHPRRNCERAVARMGGYLGGRLDSAETEKLQRHLRLCDPCQERVTRLDDVAALLGLLIVPLPSDLRDDVRAAWAAAVATASTSTGLPRTTERVLAAASAAAAVVSVVGAALVGTTRGDRDDIAVAPIAPIVTELAAPRPAELDFTISLEPDGGSDGNGSDNVSGDDDAVVIPTSDPTTTPVPAGDLGGEPGEGEPPSDTGTSSDPDGRKPSQPVDDEGDDNDGTSVTVGTSVGGTDIGVQVGSDGVGATVGDIDLGSGATPGDDAIETNGGGEVLDPVTEPINETLSGLGL